MIDPVPALFGLPVLQKPEGSRRRVRIGIVGHRDLGDSEKFVACTCSSILSSAQECLGSVVAISALAEGADSVFAEVAIRLGIPLVVVRPYLRYVSDFEDASALRRYLRLRALATGETRLRYRQRSDEAYVVAMRWIVVKSNLLLAAWNGRPAAGRGGTGAAVEHATRLRRSWVHLDVVTQTVIFNRPPPAPCRRD